MAEEIKYIPHTPKILKQLFRQRGIIPSKRFGQHFLIDMNVMLSIPEVAGLRENDVVLEIGTGTGGLTRLLAERARHVFTVEVDKKLFEVSSDILRFYGNITIINADILKSKRELNTGVLSQITTWLKEHELTSIKVVSNLPYNISTPVIINFLESDIPVELLVLMLQKDITDRLIAIPGTKEYGVLSVITGLFSEVTVARTLPPESFWPKPEVDSALVKIVVNRQKYAEKITDYAFLRKIITAIFMSRRKTLVNSLESAGLIDISREDLKLILENMQLSERVRGETLSPEQLITLSENISHYRKRAAVKF